MEMETLKEARKKKILKVGNLPFQDLKITMCKIDVHLPLLLIKKALSTNALDLLM